MKNNSDKTYCICAQILGATANLIGRQDIALFVSEESLIKRMEQLEADYSSEVQAKELAQERVFSLIEALEKIKNREQYACECLSSDLCSCDFDFMQFTAEQAIDEYRGKGLVV